MAEAARVLHSGQMLRHLPWLPLDWWSSALFGEVYTALFIKSQSGLPKFAPNIVAWRFAWMGCQLLPRQGDGSHGIRASTKVSPYLGLSIVSLRVSLGVAKSFDCRCLFDPSGVCPFCLLVLCTGRMSFGRTASYCVVRGRCSKWYLRHVRLHALSCVNSHCYGILT